MKLGNTIFVWACLLLLVCFLPVHADHSININTADKAALMSLTGIGEVKAQDIIDYRNANGPFANIEDITNVSGIGTATFNNIKDHITVSGGSEQQAEVQAQSQSQTQSQSTPSSSSSSQTSSSSGSSSSAALSEISVEGERTVIVGVDTWLEADAFDSAGRSLAAQFRWNFGDGTTALGGTVRHRWEYVGRYAVIVEASRFGETMFYQFTMTVETPELSLVVMPDGSVSIKNHSSRNADISGWTLADRGMVFTFPPNSVILSGATLRLAPSSLRLTASSQAELRYPDGRTAVYAQMPEIHIEGEESSGGEAETEESTIASSSPAPFSATPLVSGAANEISLAFEESPQEEEEKEVERERPVPSATSSQVALAGGSEASLRLWLGVPLIAALGVIAVLLARNLRRKEPDSEISKWKIIEDEG